MGFEIEIGPQEISTQSGKKTYIVEVVCVWLGNFLLREIFFTRAVFSDICSICCNWICASLMRVWGIQYIAFCIRVRNTVRAC